MNSRRPFVLQRAQLLLCLLLVGCINVSGSGADDGVAYLQGREAFSVEGKPDVVLSTFDGSIEIQSWDRPDVHGRRSRNTRPERVRCRRPSRFRAPSRVIACRWR